ncbi:hypothetical protein BGW38_009703 [Lunasporangiospora selenospora]|uniref:Lysosomal dipeptide transporter MFSD1 n=1 Tax=Lunasporangiospora selenospora TaxID=979761 RepID=A0A9P6KG22_9FUNG|nr:hypothetical protein BGW38_009703 [Lunasporangiospora selenospora]
MASQLGDKAKWPYSSASSGTSTMPEHVVAAPPTSSIPTHEFTPEIAVETLETEEEEEEQPTGPTWIRWVILGFACSIVFGNYYAFDNPAALNTPLQEYMQLSDYDYAYFLNILYAAYSIPNIVAPWFGGYAIDRFGNRKLLIILSIMVSFGHMIVCLGLERRSITAMIAGRVIFGAAESLSVTQSAITVKYFRGKELSMALGINLSVSRLGSVLNDIATPYIWKRSSVQVAFWFGLLSCVMSTLIAFALAALDWRYGRHLDLIRMDPHLLLANSQGLEKIDRLPSPSRDLDSVLDEEHVGREDKGAQGALPDEKRRITEGEERDYQGTPNPCRPPLPRVSNHGSGVNNNDRDHALSNTLVPHTFQSRIIGWIRSLVGFSLSFWILYAIGFLIVGVSVPFNSIHAGFLQMRWYHDDPLKGTE